MYQNNFKKYSIDKKYDEPLMVSGSAQVTQSIKKCNHRNPNGWCRKSNNICPLIKILINQQ